MKKVACFALLCASLAAAGEYRILKRIPVPGDGGWDYLTADAANRRLYVSHGQEVNVLDLDSGAIAGKIPDTKGVHGVALAPDAGRGFVSNGASNNVTVFDLKSLAKVSDVATGKKPDAIIYDPATKRIFAMNGGSDSTTAIDAAAGKAVATVDLGGAPEFGAADGMGLVFINLEDKNEVVKLDSKGLKVLAHWSLSPCKTPTGMALDIAARRLFVGCRSKVMAVVNADSGLVITTMPIGTGVDAAAFDPESKRIFFSNGDGTVNVFHEDSPDKYSAVETIQTEAGAKTMAFDPKTHNLFLSRAEREGRVVKPGTFTVLVVGK